MPNPKELLVSAIQDGTVIDHIAAGSALKIVRILRLADHKKIVTIGLNLKSKALGSKDIIKVEGRELTKDEADKVALLAPDASVNIVRDYKIIKKFLVTLPTMVEHFVVCPNAKCITNTEATTTRFYIENDKIIKLRCSYCEKVFSEDDIKDYNL